MLSPLDDYPIHQIAEPIRFVGTSDRNFYDRYYFNAYSPEDNLFLVAGLGQYPNLGTTDAFVAVRTGAQQHVVRASRELGLDRFDTSVAPISVEVLEGLQRLRLRCDDPDGLIELDMTFDAAVPALLEPRHFYRNHARVASDTQRLVQTGAWQGTLRVEDKTYAVEPTNWRGGRDRSWGVRPVGEPEPRGIRDSMESPGFFWIYAPIQFDDFTVVAIIHEDRSGHRILEAAELVWPAATGRPPEQLGRPTHHVDFVPGTRDPRQVVLTFTKPNGEVMRIVSDPLQPVYLALGCGYGNDDEWRHGMYHGPQVVQSRSYDVSDPKVLRRGRGVTDYAARFTLDDGREGYGLLEFTVLGPYEPYGLGTGSDVAAGTSGR